MKRLQSKRVVITGGASGIGRATALRFREEGAEVVVLDNDRALCEELTKNPSSGLRAIISDVSDPNAVEEAFAELDQSWAGLDVLINNAGISIRHSFLDISPEDWLRVVGVDLNGTFFVAQQAARRMLTAGGGCIVNMGSTNGLVGHPYYADYNSAKAGVIELTRSMALELAPKIRVNAVCPGYVLTPMQRAEYTEEMIGEVNKKIPLGRHAEPGEIAALFVFLASEDAQYITGQTIVIDGGETAGGLASR